MILAHLLDGLRCSCCAALDVLWLDPVRGLIECRECGQTALTFPEIGKEDS
ncbi:hypothetical protein [Microtetraspora fusca]|uniref:hypothetical protein n=1 Tax=Microtetraspora fusca TaxID=1997 RepID=UPI000ADD941A|nr:hypothetical protein [Microtetraspora fusca]